MFHTFFFYFEYLPQLSDKNLYTKLLQHSNNVTLILFKSNIRVRIEIIDMYIDSYWTRL